MATWLRVLYCDMLSCEFECHQCLWICLQVCGSERLKWHAGSQGPAGVTPEVNLGSPLQTGEKMFSNTKKY